MWRQAYTKLGQRLCPDETKTVLIYRGQSREKSFEGDLGLENTVDLWTMVKADYDKECKNHGFKWNKLYIQHNSF